MKPPRLKRRRYTDEERRHRIGWHRGGVGGRGVHRGASLLRRLARASSTEHVRTIRSQAWQPTPNTSTSGCCPRRGWLGRSSRLRRRLATLWQRRAVGVPIATSGPIRGPDPFIGCSSIGSTHEVMPASRASRSSCWFSSPSGRAVYRSRAALGVIRYVGARASVLVGVGSFGRPYNTRLHQTAPREHLSNSARGEPV